MQRSVYNCDVCGEEQVDGVNHWWAAILDPGNGAGFGRELRLVSLSATAKAVGAQALYHLCGQACVIRKVNEFMNGGEPCSKP
jgi:hypothetical protein